MKITGDKLLEAIAFALEAHKRQRRKGTEIPYIVHPLSVARVLLEWDCPLELVVAGLLHDTVEDAGVSFEEIERHFGEEVRKMVEALTELDKSLPWEERKSKTLERYKTLEEKILLVALADKLDNIRSIEEDLKKIGDKIWERFNRPKEKQEWYYRSLVKIFLDRLKKGPHREKALHFKEIVERVFEKV
jgi:(p)ppGpp synthase/HD superfamily hydrolase